jgi:sporulation protein YunB
MVVALLVFAISSIIILDFRLKSSILEIAKAKAQVDGVEKINLIVNEKIVSGIKYDDIVRIHKDDKGRIALIQQDTVALNKIMATTLTELSKALNKDEDKNISIPLGQLSGSRILAGYGPKIKVKILPVTQVHVDILNKFEQAGINQTRHLIYFQINNTVKVAVPFLDDEVKVSAIIPLAETIIVGEVPETYVNFNGQSELLYPFLKDIN